MRCAIPNARRAVRYIFLHFNDSTGIAIGELRKLQNQPSAFRESLDNLSIKSRVEYEKPIVSPVARIQARDCILSNRH